MAKKPESLYMQPAGCNHLAQDFVEVTRSRNLEAQKFRCPVREGTFIMRAGAGPDYHFPCYAGRCPHHWSNQSST